jgi:hypothetical protein
MDAPSCAGGIVGFIHSNNGTSVAKLDVARTYFTGNVSTSQISHTSGCAAAVIGFTDNNRNVRLQDVLVLANSITGATPNYYYSRRLPAASNNVVEYMAGLYVRKGIQLNYYSDKGVGGQIPDGIIKLMDDAVFRSKDFYTNTLNWDFKNIWTISEGEYPVLKYGTADIVDRVECCVGPTLKSYDGIYDLHGRLQNAVINPGLYIANGKKFCVK